MLRQVQWCAVGVLSGVLAAGLAVPVEAENEPNPLRDTARHDGTSALSFASANEQFLRPASANTWIADAPAVEDTPYTAQPLETAGCDGYCSPTCAWADPRYYRFWENVQLFGTFDGFQGPLDLDGLNGNFGLRFAVNGGFPVFRRRGIGGQAGTAEVLADFYGTQFTGADVRSQNFVTVGLFQRNPEWAPRLSYGFVYDWLNDDYYSGFHFGQWRVKLAWHWDEYRELGVWACIPGQGDSVALPNPPPQQGTTVNEFEPISQGVFYYRRYWDDGKSTSCWLGLAGEPGEVLFGADARVPLGPRLAIVGGFNYILPSASGPAGQDEEIWNVSFGIEFVPGGITARPGKYFPLLPLADNGNFAVRRF